MKLQQLANGQHRNIDKLVLHGRIQLALIGDTWYGLNQMSCDPMRLRNRQTRADWAWAQGKTAKEVELYRRRERARLRRDAQHEEVEDAKRVLAHYGYTVSKQGDVS